MLIEFRSLKKPFSLLLATALLLGIAAGALAMKPNDDDDKKRDRGPRPVAAAPRPEPRRVDPPKREAPNPPPQRRIETPKPPVVRADPPRRVDVPKPTPIVTRPAPGPTGRVVLADPPKRFDPPKREDKPRRDPPRIDPPKFNPPKTDKPRFDPPKPERPKIDPPKPDRPKFDPPKTDKPRFDPPKTDRPKFDPPKTDKPRFDPPKTDKPRFDPPKTDKPKLDLPKRDPSGIGTKKPGFTRETYPHPIDPNIVKPNDADADRLRGRGTDRRPGIDLPRPKPGDKPLDRPRGPITGKPDISKPGITNPGGVLPGGIVPGVIPGGPKHPGDGRRPDGRGPNDRPRIDPNDHPRIDPAEAARHNFGERLKSGDIDHLTKGKFAEQVGLRDQYKMHPQGDIARRMDLERHLDKMRGTHVANFRIDNHLADIYRHDRPYYHGVIAPNYTRDCFRYNYFGPQFYAGVCWYPNWLGWVDWSWNHHCHTLYDPRPYWCRPIIYEPAPVWVYYQVPVWQPLPTVACGTWVDVQPEVVKEKYDLQLLAVRFVDPGHPGEKLGPRYRVWFRNNSDKPITEPFSITAFAANDDKLVQGLPQSGVRVTSVDAGDTQSVDIRLPIETLTFGKDAEGKPGPFAALHVLLDSNREIEETTRENNGVCLKTGDVLPVDPAAFGAKPSSAASGDEMILAGEGFGPLPGQVIVRMGDLEFDAEILGWYDLGVRFTLPKVPLNKQSEADVIVIRGDSAAANPVKIVVLPPGMAEQPDPAAEGPRLQ